MTFWAPLGLFLVEVAIPVAEAVPFVFGLAAGGIISRGVGDDGDGTLGEEIGAGAVERVGRIFVKVVFLSLKLALAQLE